MARRLVTRDFGQQMLFTSTNGVTIPYTPSTTAFSVAFWAKVRVNAAGGRFIDWQDTGPALGFRIQQLATNDIQISMPGSTTLTFNYGAKSHWFHFVLTYSFSGTSSIKCYLNGVLTSSTSGGTQMTVSSTTLRIGNRSTGGGANPAESLMDNTYFFDKEITQTEIDNLYYDGSIPSELRCGIQFDNNLTDISGNGFNGTLVGGTYVTEPPLRTPISTPRTLATNRVLTRDMGTALRFGGGTNTVITPITSNTWFTSDFTISAWIKPTVTSSGNANKVIDKSGGSAGEGGFSFNVDGNTMRFRVNAGTNRNSGFIPVNGSYVHVLVTCTTAGLVTHYVNGLVSGTPASTSALSNVTTSNPVNIGNRQAGTSPYTGLIDEPRIWNRALTATEVANMYFSNVVPRNGLVGEWLFNETTGTIALDSSGNGNSGTITGCTYTLDTPLKARTSV